MTEPTPHGSTSISTASQDRASYSEFAQRSDFIELRRRYRRFAFPATIAFLVWYVAYVLCNNWARGLLETQVIGHINVAVVFGLLQFVSTFVIAALYARHAKSALDPLANQLQDDFDVQTSRTKLDRQTGR